MRLLADENFPKPIVEVLRASGHDVLWARTDCRGWKDPALLELAESEARIMLTLDKDSGRLPFSAGSLSNNPGWSCSGFILRLPRILNRSYAHS